MNFELTKWVCLRCGECVVSVWSDVSQKLMHSFGKKHFTTFVLQFSI